MRVSVHRRHGSIGDIVPNLGWARLLRSTLQHVQPALKPVPRPAEAILICPDQDVLCAGECTSPYQCFLEPLPSSASTARRLTRAILEHWAVEHLLADATLVVSELVTNAFRHTRRLAPSEAMDHSLQFFLARQDDHLLCAVLDHQPEADPMFWPLSADAEGGRGLRVVEALSTAWGWTLIDLPDAGRADQAGEPAGGPSVGKVVWALLPAAESAAAPTSPPTRPRFAVGSGSSNAT